MKNKTFTASWWISTELLSSVFLCKVVNGDDTPETANDDKYNDDLTLEEIQDSIKKLKGKDCPGPDLIHPSFIHECGSNIALPLKVLFQTCWDQGQIPKLWKKDNRIYIPKPGKTNYNTEKAYRSLSLSSCVGKMLEGIVTRRLIALLQDKNLIEPQQYAYTQGRDTSQALLDMTLDIQNGFKQGKSTGAVLVDFEGAFDAVWREGILYKLTILGIKGRLYKYVKSFLSERQSRSFINSTQTDWITTNVGIPQGSVMGPILYIIFTKDISNHITISHIKFADDLSMWITHTDIQVTSTVLQHNIDNLIEWTRKWRQNLNIQKTEVMAFTQKGHIPIDIKTDQIQLKQVTEKRILGVILDENLSYIPHVEACTAKALGHVTKLSVLTNGLRGANAELLITLFKTCVRPTLEYGYSVWCCTSNLAPLERVQYQGLRKALGAMHGSPASAINVTARVMPIDLRLEEVLLNSYLKISRKKDNDPLKCKIINLINDAEFMNHRVITTLHKFKRIQRQLPGYLDLNKVEPLLTDSIEDCMAHKIELVDYMPASFGSSNNRTTLQAKAALNAAQRYLAGTKGDIVAFTDGSALKNPGPCGAGTAIYWKGICGQPTLHKRSVSSRSSSYNGELQAIDLALQQILKKTPPLRGNKIHIITDCQSALQSVVKGDKTKNFGWIINSINNSVKELHNRQMTIKIYWTAGHVSLEGNDLADRLAKEAAADALTNTEYDTYIPLTEIKNLFRKTLTTKWQKRWNTGTDARHTYNLLPEVKVGGFKSLCERETETKLIRLQLGTTLLKEHMNKIMPTIYDTPNCDCGMERATIEHYLIRCPSHKLHRNTLLHKLEYFFLKFSTRTNFVMSLQILLGKTSDFNWEVTTQLRSAVADYIRATETDI